MSQTPLTIIAGFLGSGKTTLVNHLLRTASRRWGVLVNDFGAINIDAALIQSRDGDTIALTNGCVCCGMGDDLGAGLASLAARHPTIEHAIIESSGVSDPGRIAQLALVEPGFNLEPIVVLADASAVVSHLQDRWVADTVRGQLAAAEVLILNKLDRTDAASLATARAAMRTIQPDARLVEVSHGALPDIDLLSFPKVQPARFLADIPPAHEFRTWSWRPPAPFDRQRLRKALGALPRSVLRVKGFCRLAPEGAMHLLQFVSGQWVLSPTPLTHSGLVAVGTPEMPDDDNIAERFSQALAFTHPEVETARPAGHPAAN